MKILVNKNHKMIVKVLLSLSILLLIGTTIASCVGLDPVEYIDSPIEEQEPERVATNSEAYCNMDLCT